MGVEALAIDHQPYGKDDASRETHERAMDAALRDCRVEVVCLAGYMRVLTPWFVHAWSGRMLNIHPSLLPHFPGLDTHRRALEAGHADAGCTVHLVTEGVDEGPILGQARVPVLPGDTAQTLAERVVEAEHVLYPATLAQFAREWSTSNAAARF
jgi:formyltetrahydrofolate-dependent phosphoribosylglycinamide formyltransferase